MVGKSWWLASIFLCAFGSGCTPGPEATCRRLEELGKKDPSGINLSPTKCIARMNEMKQRDPDAYRCTARLVSKMSSFDTALLGVSVCDQGGPAPP